MSHSWSDGRPRKSLPIDPYLKQIVDLLYCGRTAVIEAEPGAGKSIRLAQAVHLAISDMPIWLVQPMRNAVRLLGRRIATELGTIPGGVVGWKLFGEEPVESNTTLIHLRTYEAMANMIHGRKGSLPDGLIIVDEAHLRSIEGDLLLGMIQERLAQSPGTWVWITSATIDTEKFAAYFGGAPIISVPGRCHPVATEVFQLHRNEPHSDGAARAAREVLERWKTRRLFVPTENGTSVRSVHDGTVIVLLPGKSEIRRTIASLKKTAERLGLTSLVEILPCQGDSTPEEEDAVQAPLRAGVMRFVCGTDVVRSSVTLTRVQVVIDSLRVNRSFVDPYGIARLDEVQVSGAEANQARGRAGRTEPGLYIPVSEGDEYHRLPRFPLPAILREPLTTITLRVAKMGRRLDKFPWLDSPDPESALVATERLKRLAALDDDENITERGRLLVKFPVDPELGMALIDADRLGVLPEEMIVVCVREVEGFFFRPRGQMKEVPVTAAVARGLLVMLQSRTWGLAPDYAEPNEQTELLLAPEALPSWIQPLPSGSYTVICGERGSPFKSVRDIADLVWQAWAGETRSDFVAMVQAYRAFKAEERRLQRLADSSRKGAWSASKREQRLRAWCDEHFLKFKRMVLADNTIRRLREAIDESPLRLRDAVANYRAFDAEALTKALASGLPQNVAVYTGYLTDYEGPLGRFQLGYQSAAGTILPHLILIGGLCQVPGNDGKPVLLCDHAAPFQPHWLTEVLPQFSAQCRLGDVRYEPSYDQVVETMVYSLNGQEVGREIVLAADDEAATLVLANWLADQM